VIAALALVAAVQAPSFIYSPNCQSGSQHELNICASQEYAQADTEMKKQLEAVTSLMRRVDQYWPAPPDFEGPNHYDAILSGQQAWIVFRDAHCQVFAAGRGSMVPMLRDKCRRDLTKARTQQLRALMINPATGNPYFEDQ
jgi:uncharacterized protein YecT (DUF1311 family)